MSENDLIQEFMVERGLCDDCKEKSEADIKASYYKYSLYDSLCEDCHDKYKTLSKFMTFLKSKGVIE